MDGFAVLPNFVEASSLEVLRRETDRLLEGSRVRGGVRNAVEESAVLRTFGGSGAPAVLASGLLGPEIKPTKLTIFDKSSAANWKVPWHQDLTIVVEADKSRILQEEQSLQQKRATFEEERERLAREKSDIEQKLSTLSKKDKRQREELEQQQKRLADEEKKVRERQASFEGEREKLEEEKSKLLERISKMTATRGGLTIEQREQGIAQREKDVAEREARVTRSMAQAASSSACRVWSICASSAPPSASISGGLSSESRSSRSSRPVARTAFREAPRASAAEARRE